MADWTQEQWQELYQGLIRRSNTPGHFTSDLGLIVTKIEHFLAEAEITPDRHACNPRGILHGGALYTMLDHMAGLAACTTGRGCVTLDTSVNYLRSVPAGKKLTIRAEVVKPGSNIVVCTASAFGPDGKELARGSFTYFMLEELNDTLRLCAEVSNHR